MSNTVTRTLTVLLAGWKYEVAAAAQYRGDILLGTLVTTVWMGVAAAPAMIVGMHVDDASGWTVGRLLFLLAIWYVLDAVLWVWLLPNASALSTSVQTGTLDALLLRPVSSLVLCSLRLINAHDLPKLLLGVGLGAVAIQLEGGPASLGALAAFGLALLGAVCLLWSLAVLSSFKALTHVQFDGAFALHAAHNLARVPTSLYGQPLRTILHTIVPVAFLTTVPSDLFFGAAPTAMAGWSLLVAAIAVTVTVLLWRREIKHYAGAMG